MDAIDLIIAGDYLTLLEQLKSGLDPNYTVEGVSLLHYAVVHDQHAIVKLLVEWGADVNKKDIDLNETPKEFCYATDNKLLIDILNEDKPTH